MANLAIYLFNMNGKSCLPPSTSCSTGSPHIISRAVPSLCELAGHQPSG